MTELCLIDSSFFGGCSFFCACIENGKLVGEPHDVKCTDRAPSCGTKMLHLPTGRFP